MPKSIIKDSGDSQEKNKSKKFRHKICLHTHGLVSKFRRLRLFNKEDDFKRKLSWRSDWEASSSVYDEDSRSSFGGFKSDLSQVSSDNESLTDHCSWEVCSDSGFCEDSDCFSQERDNDKEVLFTGIVKTASQMKPPVKRKKFTPLSKSTPKAQRKVRSPKCSSLVKEKLKSGSTGKSSKSVMFKTKKITDYYQKTTTVKTIKSAIFPRHKSAITFSKPPQSLSQSLNLIPRPSKLSPRKSLTEPRKKRKMEDSPIRKCREVSKPSVKKSRSELTIASLLDDNSLSNFSFFDTIFRSRENILDLGVSPIQQKKECVSCGTTRTPMWRDADENTPLCNACGIRWKKYRVRCTSCWYVPMKNERVPYCSNCGHFQTLKKVNSMRRYKSCIY